ncbi:MAG: ABC transporter permease [Acidimicrobiia bacterium]|nr:ABC transporter permease [Acidimicrobiia bacterium]
MTQPQRNAPSLATASLRVFEMSLGEMLWSRRTIFMGLVVGLPVLMALVIRLFDLAGASGIRINNMAVNGPAIFGLMVWAFFVKFSVPVLGVFYGTSLIADEVEDKTITYLFTRPIAREAVLIGKYLAYLACTIFVVLPSIVLVWLLVIPMGGSLGANFLDLIKDLGIVAVGLAVYGAVFAVIGAYFKRPLLIGLAFIFGWETAVLAFPGSFKMLSVAYYLQGLVPHAMPNDSFASMMQAFFQEPPSLTGSLATMAVILVVFLGFAARIVARREYVLEQ